MIEISVTTLFSNYFLVRGNGDLRCALRNSSVIAHTYDLMIKCASWGLWSFISYFLMDEEDQTIATTSKFKQEEKLYCSINPEQVFL